MALCAVLYLAWWVVFLPALMPGRCRGRCTGSAPDVSLWPPLRASTGAVFIALGASGLAAGTGPNGWWFALGAIAAYILLAGNRAFLESPHHHRAAAIRGVGRFGALCHLCSGSGRYPWPYRHMVSRCDHLLRVRPVTYLLRSVLPPGRHAVLHSRSASLRSRRHFLGHTAPVAVKQPSRE